MNIIFLTMVKMQDINLHGVYSDLMRKFAREGYGVYIVNPMERREGKPTTLIENDNVHILSVRTLNVEKSNVIEKGCGQIFMEFLYKRAIKKYFKNVKFDFILYSTPPITFTKVIKYLRNNNHNALTYLLLKDIFPKNAVDLGMLSTSGIKGLLYNYFRKQEKEMYALSDYIGCMSPANVKYVLEHNLEIDKKKVEIAPNSFEVVEDTDCDEYRASKKDVSRLTREKFHLPLDKIVFFYGGNLGKPQGIPFLLKCLEANANRKDCHFLIVGDGQEYSRIETWIKDYKPKSVSLYKKLPKEEYDKLANACDVGLIFLDYRFTIPNYPSRLLNTLMLKKPIIACTDCNCDIGTIAEENGYGYFCPSNDVGTFTATVDKMLKSDISKMGQNGYSYFLDNYTVQATYDAITKHLKIEK